ncbi:TetR/AcrR family transcriptional regulator [Achromobacter aegrifaciens]|uniref:TetR/AcrR family transcriptional regulator n=1 Tax=Achromobacter aegrifaciens TaxID=1287736 RepID=UPI000F73B3C7|nr:TetR/AcrR family transcriptional regulator [Achromobacter aegrifaciens]RSE93561.1 TetR/AcrR family transcriptional regulator [Achromobacter aegrifaciens]
MRKIDPIKQQERRTQILAAAADCFAEQGFHSTSPAQICARAGMSPGNLFHYYGSKAEIIEAMIASDTESARERMRQACAEPDARQALTDWVAAQLAQQQDPAYVRLGMEILAEAVRNPRVHALVLENEAARKAGLMALLEAVWAQRPPPPAAAEMADTLLLLLDGVYSRSVVDPAFGAAAGSRLLEPALSRCLPGDAQHGAAAGGQA